MEKDNVMTKEAAINAMEQGGYKVAHRFFSEGEYIGQLMTSITRMKKELGYQRKTFGNVVQNKNGKQDGE